jgi:hypothetical protein
MKLEIPFLSADKANLHRTKERKKKICLERVGLTIV